ncbi:MAG: hypothetical protein ACKVWR_19750 [Acidimicrobiales bacterium]
MSTTVETLQLRGRFEAMLAGENRSAAEIRWLTGPHGLLAVCRDAVAQGELSLLRDERLADLLDDLDDQSPAGGAVAPSTRAAGLVAAAELAADALTGELTAGALAGRPHPDPDLRAEQLRVLARAFEPAGGDRWLPPSGLFARSGQLDLLALVDAALAASPHPALLSARDLLAHLLGRPTPPDRPATVAVLTSRHVDGEVLELTLSSRPGPPGLALDPLVAPFSRADAEFEAALAQAAALAGAGALSLRWSAHSSRTNRPVDLVTGPSVGLGAAIAARRLLHRDAPPVDPTWAFTGALDHSGGVRSLLGAGRDLGDYRNKLVAAGARTVVAPAADEPDVAALAERSGLPVRVLGAATLAEAEGLVARHLAGKAHYELALAAERVRAPRRRGGAAPLAGLAGLVGLVGLGALVALAALGGLRRHGEDRAADALRSEAWGPSVELTLGGRAVEVQQNEVGASQYALCMDHGPELCETAGPLNPKASTQALKPVRGLDAAQARAFCEWLGGDLLSVGEWEELVLEHDDHEFSLYLGDHELQPAVNEARSRDELNNLVGNVAEWTRTACEDGVCYEWPAGEPPPQLRVVGVSFANQAAGVLDEPADALRASGERLVDGGAPTPGFVDIGFRCIRPA